MIEWKEAAPLIGVLVTAFFGFIGVVVAQRRREGTTATAAAAVPIAVAGAIAERGAADALSFAIGGLTAVIVAYSEREEKWREDEEDLRRKHHREIVDELRRMTLAIEAQGRR